MSYVSSNLIDGESVQGEAKVHWFVFLIPAFTFLISFFPDMPFVLAVAFSLIMLAWALIIKLSTEFAVTNKRVIAKTGFIVRNTTEINLSKVESLGVKQGILGRLFGYGTLTVHGTGGVKAPFRFIASPLEIRKVLNTELSALETK